MSILLKELVGSVCLTRVTNITLFGKNENLFDPVCATTLPQTLFLKDVLFIYLKYLVLPFSPIFLLAFMSNTYGITFEKVESLQSWNLNSNEFLVYVVLA